VRLRVRILQKETQNFLRCGRAASGPGVAGTVDIPMPQDLTFRRRRGSCGHSHALFDGLGAVVWMHGGFAVAVENDGRDRLPDRARLAAGSASLRPTGIKNLGTRNS
jgi:hypothetical protein